MPPQNAAFSNVNQNAYLLSRYNTVREAFGEEKAKRDLAYALRANVDRAIQYGDAPQAAKALPYAQEAGIPIDSALPQLTELEKAKRRLETQKDVNYDRMVRENPALSTFLSKDDFSRVAYDHIDNLKQLEDTLNSTTALSATLMRNPDMGVISRLARSWKAGGYEVELGNLGARLLVKPEYDEAEKAESARLKALLADPNLKSDNTLFNLTLGLAQQLGQMSETVVLPALAGGLAGGGAGLAVGTAAGGLPGAAAGALTGAAWGARAAVLGEIFRMETGSTLDEIYTMAQQKGVAFDPGTARVVAALSGGVNTALEVAEIHIAVRPKVYKKLLGNTFSKFGGDKITGLAMAQALKKKFSKKAAEKALELGTDWATAVGGNVVEEVLQEVSSAAAEETYKMLHGADFEQTTQEEFLDRLWNTAEETFRRMALFPLAAAGAEHIYRLATNKVNDTVADNKAQLAAAQNTGQWLRTMTAAGDAMKSRSPEAFGEFVALATQDGKSVTVHLDELEEAAESGDTRAIDIEAFDTKETQAFYQRLKQAKENGENAVQVPLAEVLESRKHGDEKWQQLDLFTSYGPMGTSEYTAEQQAKGLPKDKAEQEERVKEYTRRLEEEENRRSRAAQSRKNIYDTTRARFMEGVAPEHKENARVKEYADTAATLVSSASVAMSANSSLSAEDIADRYMPAVFRIYQRDENPTFDLRTALAQRGRTAQGSIAAAEELMDREDRVTEQVLDAFFEGGRIPLRISKAAPVIRAWQQFMRDGMVRDEKLVARLAEDFIHNTLVMAVNTKLVGHDAVSPEDIDSRFKEEKVQDDFSDWAENYFSDSVIAPLMRLSGLLLDAKTAEEKLVLLDQMLNVVHQRGDVASMFVEGGSITLSQLFEGGEDNRTLYQRAPVFYSSLIRGISGTELEEASPKHWKIILEKLKGTGVKQEEIDFYGLEDWLKEQSGKVSKTDILEYLRANELEIKQVVFGDADFAHIKKEGKEWVLSWEDYGVHEKFDTFEDAHQAKARLKRKNRPGYEQYRLSSRDYGEILLTLPMDWNPLAPPVPFLGSGPDAVVSRGGMYVSPHYKSQLNPVAQARFGVQEDRRGEKVFFVEEIQSDWHQKGAGGGYLSDFFKRIKPVEGKPGFWELLLQGSSMYESRQAETRGEAEAAFARIYGELVPPDAPFKTTWAELAFKRMLRMAVDKGINKIAWTTGAQQVERYGLDRKATFLTYNVGAEEGQYTVRFGGDEGIFYVEHVISIEDIEKKYGKEIADKIRANKGEIWGGKKWIRTFAVPEISFKNKGMTRFYDELLPSRVNKLAKKFGGKVTSAELDFGGERGVQKVHMLEIPEAMRDAVLEGQSLFQRKRFGISDERTPEEERAKTEGVLGYYRPEERLLNVYREGDIETLVHELGHAFLDAMTSMAQDGVLTTQAHDDLKAFFKWSGFGDDENAIARFREGDAELMRAAHEKFANGFVMFVHEGEAPAPELAGLFRRFRKFLGDVTRAMRRKLAVEKQMKGVPSTEKYLQEAYAIKVDDPMRRLFSRLLATEDQRNDIEMQVMPAALFEGPEASGIPASEFAKLKQLYEEASKVTMDKLEAALVRATALNLKKGNAKTKALENERKKKLAEYAKEERENLESVPGIYSLRNFLRKGIGAGEGAVHRLNLEDVRRILGDKADKVIGGLTGRYGIAQKDGLPLLPVAEQFGYSSVEKMLEELLYAPTIEDMSNSEAENRLSEEFGEAYTRQGMIERAAKEVFNPFMERALRAEMQALQELSGIKFRALRLAKQRAAVIIGRAAVAGFDVKHYAKQMQKESNTALDALKRNDLQKAVEAKQRQLTMYYAGSLARAAEEQLLKGKKWVKKQQTSEVQRKRDPAANEALDLIFSYFRIGKAYQKPLVPLFNSLDEWVEEKRLDDELPIEWDDALPLLLTNRGERRFSSLTVKEALEFYRDAESLFSNTTKRRTFITLLGGTTLVNGRQEAILNTVEAAQEYRRELEIEDFSNIERTGGEKLRRRLEQFKLAHFNLSDMLRLLDSNKDGGFWQKTIMWPANAIGAAQVELLNEKNARLLDALLRWRSYYKARGIDPSHDQAHTIDPTGAPMLSPGRMVTREEVLSMLLHSGSETNLAQLCEGEGVTPEAIGAFLESSITEADWEFVKALKEIFDSLQPRTFYTAKMLRGKEPKLANRLKVKTNFGELEGWYMPMYYDANTKRIMADKRKERVEELPHKKMVKNVEDSFTEERAAYRVRGGKLDLRLANIERAIADQIYYISWAGWIRDTQRLLSTARVPYPVSPELAQEINDIVSGLLGEEYDPESNVAKQMFNEEVEARLGGEMRPSVGETIVGYYGEEFYASLMRLVEQVATGDYVRQEQASFIADMLRKHATFATLGFNVVNTMLNFGGGFLAGVRVPPKYLLSALTDYFTPGRGDALRQEALLTSEILSSLRYSFMREKAENINKVTERNWLTRLQTEYGFALVYWSQEIVNTIVYTAARNHWLDSHEALTPEERNKAPSEAARHADQVVLDTQGGGMTKDLAMIQQGSPWMKLFTTFMSYFMRVFAETYKQSVGIYRSDAEFTDKMFQAARVYLFAFLLPAVWEASITAALGGLGGSDEDKEKEFLKTVMDNQIGYAGGGILIIRDMTSSIRYALGTTDFRAQMTPMWLRGVAAASDTVRKLGGGRELDDSFIRSLTATVGYLFGVPGTSSLLRAERGLSALEQGKTDNWGAILSGGPR